MHALSANFAIFTLPLLTDRETCSPMGSHFVNWDTYPGRVKSIWPSAIGLNPFFFTLCSHTLSRTLKSFFDVVVLSFLWSFCRFPLASFCAILTCSTILICGGLQNSATISYQGWNWELNAKLILYQNLGYNGQFIFLTRCYWFGTRKKYGWYVLTQIIRSWSNKMGNSF